MKLQLEIIEKEIRKTKKTIAKLLKGNYRPVVY